MGVLAGKGVAGSINEIRRALNQQSGAGNLKKLLFIQKDSSIRIRFLQEPDEFYQFYEHYTGTAFVPALENDPLDQSPDPKVRSKSLRHMVNILDLEDNEVKLVKMSQDLTNRVMLRFQKYGTLLDRDYEIMREGGGFDTTYDVQAEEVAPIDVNRWRSKLHDMELFLLQEADRYHGTAYADEYLKKHQQPNQTQAIVEPDPEPVKVPDITVDDDDIPFDVAPIQEISGEALADPWSEAKLQGKPCEKDPKSGLCAICGFDLTECLSS